MTASASSTSWDSVYRAVPWVVHWGIAHRELSGIKSIGIDEIQHRRELNYLPLVYQMDQVRMHRYVASIPEGSSRASLGYDSDGLVTRFAHVQSENDKGLFDA